MNFIIKNAVFFVLIIVFPLNAQNTLDNLGLTNSTPSLAAYSLRKLRSNYSGSAIQVRRSSDLATLDIGFTSSGDLDQAALLAFTGINNGYVSIWYDQSGNGHNAAGTGNPLIVNSGVVNKSNGRASILFSGNLMGFSPISPFNSYTDHTLNAVAAATTGAIVSLSTTTGRNATNKNSSLGAGYNGTGSCWFGGFDQNANYASGNTTSSLSVRSKTYNSNTINGFFNGLNVFTKAVSYNLNTSNILIGAQNYNPNQILNGSASEVIAFTSALLAPQRLSLESNQGAYYSVAVNTTLTFPTITGFRDIMKIYGNLPFALTAPTSNSSGVFTYTSSNPSIVSVINNIVTIVGIGRAKIYAVQAADTNFGSRTVAATVSVNEKGLNKYGQLEMISTNCLTKYGSISISGLTNNEVTQNGKLIKALNIGDSYQGGIVAYILQQGDPGYMIDSLHGLIAAETDQSSMAQWGCIGNIVGATGISIGTGNSNTTIIINSCLTSGIAAQIAKTYNGGGYGDWYLPSKDELNKLFLNRILIGGFTGSFYWSSSEGLTPQNDNYSWGQFFTNGNQQYYDNIYGVKVGEQSVRAVRSF